MKHFLLIALIALSLVGVASAQSSPQTGSTTRPEVLTPTISLQGVLYDAGGVWVTDFVLPVGIIVTVVHDPLLGDIAFVTVPPMQPFFVDMDVLGDFVDNDDDVGLPVTAGSGHCWDVPYGPPNPDGTWPMQSQFIKIIGEGGTMSEALNDYKAQVDDAMSSGATPAPSGSC